MNCTLHPHDRNRIAGLLQCTFMRDVDNQRHVNNHSQRYASVTGNYGTIGYRMANITHRTPSHRALGPESFPEDVGRRKTGASALLMHGSFI